MKKDKQNHGHPLFDIIADELKALHSEKNRQYATISDPLRNFTGVGRLIDKLLKPGINRPLAAVLALVAKQIDAVYDMVGEGKVGTIDSIEDKLRDIAVYSIIAQIIIRESQMPENHQKECSFRINYEKKNKFWDDYPCTCK